MAQAIVDPGELRMFAQMLKQFNQDLSDRANAVSAQLNSLGSTWRDQENIKFTEHFDEHMRYLSRFIEANNQHIPYLVRKAERVVVQCKRLSQEHRVPRGKSARVA